MANPTRKELLELLGRCSPRTRKTVLRVIEGKVSQDGVSFIRESMNFVEPDQTVRSVEVFGTRTCDFGHLADQHTHILSICQACGKHTCSSPQCYFTCLGCGKTFCRRHISVYPDGEYYCSKCRWKKWLRCFFDVRKRSKP